jgi:MFS family permease
MRSRLRLDGKLVLLAICLIAGVFFVPSLFRMAVIAAGLAMLVLAAMPWGTRRLMFAAMIGNATGATAILSFVVPIFQSPVTQAFHWSQVEYAFLITLVTLILIVISPAAGRLFDTRGVRKFALASAAAIGLALLSLHWLHKSLFQLYLAFSLIQFLGVGLSSIAFSRIIARWFDQVRGQAFGTAMSGIGIGGAILSAFSQSFIDLAGWRGAFAGLAVILFLVTLPILFFWLHETPERMGTVVDGASSAAPVHTRLHDTPAEPFGLTARESRRDPTFWKMALAFFVMSLGTGGVMLQLIPILRSNGIDAEQAAVIQGALGLALIIGPAFAGFLMDRFFAPRVAALLVLFPMTGTALLATGVTGWQAVIAAMSLGMAAGAEVNFIAYLATRYFGTRAYSENFGWLYAAFGVGCGAAPLLTSLCADLLHSHTPVLYLFVATFATASLLLLRLPAYPEPLSGDRSSAGGLQPQEA